MPVYAPFVVARGLTVGEVFSVQAVFGIAMVLFEVPTGYLCDRFGRRRVLVIGAGLNAAGLAGFAFAHDFAQFAAIEIVLAAGQSLVSGADIALIYDVLDSASAGRDARRRALSHYLLAQVLGEAGAALVGGLVAAQVSLDAVAWLTACVSLLPFLIALGLRDLRGAQASVRPADILRAARHIAAAPLLRLVFANMVVFGLATFIVVWLLQPYWREQGVGLRWFGVLWAATLVTVGVAGRCAPLLARSIGAGGVVLVLAGLTVLGYGGMATFGGAAGVASGFLVYASRGLNSVQLKEAFNHEVPSRLRATSNSVATGTFRLAFAAVGPPLGLLLDHAGEQTTLAALGCVFLLAFLLLALPLARALR